MLKDSDVIWRLFQLMPDSFWEEWRRPDVDKITGLSPVISIEQKTTNKNPRSTVGTITEIYDFLRLLICTGQLMHIPRHQAKKWLNILMIRYLNLSRAVFQAKRSIFWHQLVKGRKGHYKELFEQLRRKGFLNVRINGEIRELVHGMKLDRYKTHFIELVIDKFRVGEITDKRLHDSVLMSLDQGDGVMMVLDSESNEPRYFSRHLMCPVTGFHTMNLHLIHFHSIHLREHVLIATDSVKFQALIRRN